MARILLIEDSPTDQIVIRAVLGHHELTSCTTLKDARKQLSVNNFDLVLLDVGLPDGVGFDFIQEMKQKLEVTSTSVIFITGKSEIEDRLKGLSLGADDYITKPLELQEFRARIEAKLRRVAFSNPKKASA
jgi:two-component system OmpR family response regulator